MREDYMEAENPYEYPLASLTGLTSDLLEEVPPKEDQRYVCYEVAGNSRYARIGRVLERTVFEDAFDNDAVQMQEEYTPYEQHSRFFISIDVESKRPTGVIRAIESTDINELKTCHDLFRDKPDLFNEASVRAQHNIAIDSMVWDIGTLGVLREYRGKAGAISIQLYRAMYNAAQREGVEHLVAMIDKKPYKKLTKFLGVPFVKLAGQRAFDYLGSDLSQPVYGYVPEFYDTMSQRKLPLLGRKVARVAFERLVEGSEDETIYELSQH